MTVAVRSTSTATNDGVYSNPVTVTKPAGTASGDVLVAVMFQSFEAAGNSVSLPAGFTVVGGTGSVATSTGIWCQTAYKVAGNSEPASYTFTGAGNPSAEIILFAVSGASASAPIGAAPVYTSGATASTSHTAPTVNPGTTNDLVLTAVSCVSTSAQYTAYPAGMTAGTDFLDPTNYEEATWATQQATSNGATGTKTFTHTTSAQWVGVALSLQPTQPGTPILLNSPSVARCAVEIAWGAQPGSDPSTWSWTDVSADVEYDQKIKIGIGKQTSETTTPPAASLALTLDNRSGNYSRGPQSANYPNVRKGVPIRVRIFTTGNTVRFLGQVSAFTPAWDSTGRWSTVQVTAAGTKRRLSQPQPGGYSLLRAYLTYLANTNTNWSYWPCEETAGTHVFGPSRTGVPSIQISGGAPSLASFSGFAGTGPIPTLSTGESWFGRPTISNGVSASIAFSIVFLLATPVAGFADQTQIVQLNTAGSTSQVQLRYAGTPTAGGLRVLGVDFKGNTTIDSGTLLPASVGKSVAGNNCVVVISMANNVLALNVFSFNEANSGATAYVYSVSTGTLLAIDSFTFSPAGVMQGASIGHISCQQAGFESGSDYYPYAYGYEFDLLTAGAHVTPWERMGAASILDQELAPIQVHAAGTDQNTIFPPVGVARMGPYPAGASFLALAEDAALVDGGMLADGLDSGGGLSLTFYTRDSAENIDAVLTLDASISQTEHPVAPVDDDLGTVNTVTASRTNGATITVSDTTDQLSTTAVGSYGASETINVETDAQLGHWAGWRVHLGTVDDYRWPTTNLWLHHKPALVAAWLATTLMSRIDVTNLSTVRSQLPAGTLSLIVLGWQETIDQHTWSVVVNTASYDPWQVAVLAQPSGDTGEFLARLETDGSQTNSTVSAGATSIPVLVTAGPAWTQAADDMPMFCNVGGWRVKVTAIGAPSGGVQTFTVDPTTVPNVIPSGRAVTVWKAPALAR